MNQIEYLRRQIDRTKFFFLRIGAVLDSFQVNSQLISVRVD